MDELVRLNRIIEDCEHTLHVMENRRKPGRFVPTDAQVAEVISKLEKAKRDYDWFASALRRYSEAHP